MYSSYSSSTATDMDYQKHSADPPQLRSGNPPVQTPPGTEAPWSTGLFSCFDDVPNCCVTCYAPCVTFGRIAEIVDKGETSCCKAGVIFILINLIPCGLHLLVDPCCLGSYRTKLRQQYSLPEAPCNDCLISCFREPCALCQHYRELKNQGFDMSAVNKLKKKKLKELAIESATTVNG
ncbi:hypothetical protein RHGRI_026661 [Rhododendron griersonianum]|uniref:Uncharacterized protein n=1 Tax=Rhododendron griersonianum TaxID=479676 RepID=A0AAV6ITR8_9ERIC|nr:hypothetical protein RHGRI_026661 [Rhododendron griersonianum]